MKIMEDVKTYTTPDGNVIKVVRYDTGEYGSYVHTEIENCGMHLTVHKEKCDAIASAQFLQYWVAKNFG